MRFKNPSKMFHITVLKSGGFGSSPKPVQLYRLYLITLLYNINLFIYNKSSLMS